MMRRLLIAGATLLLGCSGDTATETLATLAGRYSLVTINGARMPATIPHDAAASICGPSATSRTQVNVGQLTFDPAGTFRLYYAYYIVCSRPGVPDQLQQQLAEVTGTFAPRGDFVELRSSSGTVEASRSGNTLNMLAQAAQSGTLSSLVFQKE